MECGKRTSSGCGGCAGRAVRRTAEMPILGRPLIVVSTLVYFAACLGLGIWALRRTRSARDFWVARQGLGVVVTGLATMAAAFSGFVFLGGPGLTYRIGL